MMALWMPSCSIVRASKPYSVTRWRYMSCWPVRGGTGQQACTQLPQLQQFIKLTVLLRLHSCDCQR